MLKLENKEAVLDTAYIAVIPEIDAIWSRSRSIRGDIDGSRKLYAKLELAYVILMAHPLSELAYIKDEEDRSLKAIEFLSLNKLYSGGIVDAPINWKPDIRVQSAVKKYKQLLDNVIEIRMYRKLVTTLDSLSILLELLEEDVNGKVKIAKKLKAESEVTLALGQNEEQAMLLNSGFKTVGNIVGDKNDVAASSLTGSGLSIGDISRLIDTVSSITKQFEKALIDKERISVIIQKSVRDNDIIRGGKKKANRQEPDADAFNPDMI